jgi:hypothetical protein
MKLMATKKGQDNDGQLKRANNVMKIMMNLKKSGFKDRVIKECKNMFYEPLFEEKLDSNRDLIGFDNGVYDLVSGEFREGCPDDYVSLSVGYDYEEYSEDHPSINGILEFYNRENESRQIKSASRKRYREGLRDDTETHFGDSKSLDFAFDRIALIFMKISLIERFIWCDRF